MHGASVNFPSLQHCKRKTGEHTFVQAICFQSSIVSQYIESAPHGARMV